MIEAGSEKEGAAPTFKKGFGFHPMLAFLDRPADPCGGEPLAGLLRPGNAGANTVADQIEVTEEALEQLPADVWRGLIIGLSLWEPEGQSPGSVSTSGGRVLAVEDRGARCSEAEYLQRLASRKVKLLTS